MLCDFKRLDILEIRSKLFVFHPQTNNFSVFLLNQFILIHEIPFWNIVRKTLLTNVKVSRTVIAHTSRVDSSVIWLRPYLCTSFIILPVLLFSADFYILSGGVLWNTIKSLGPVSIKSVFSTVPAHLRSISSSHLSQIDFIFISIIRRLRPTSHLAQFAVFSPQSIKFKYILGLYMMNLIT